ncbi:AAA family ATPase [Asticcacaulis machinosus]|uniref:Pilus assembly protein CpaE n=1 Tax=Asticcacaulis machinosus TaxID=2984211 RepID=A0ABT5HLJ7_9CAUL|nr:pilus assembly protein CpaE [Asticcacaulis machinosus]MDC7677119.1 pilus assembly protein CpaE [Asticcacaulis machinosus]
MSATPNSHSRIKDPFDDDAFPSVGNVPDPFETFDANDSFGQGLAHNTAQAGYDFDEDYEGDLDLITPELAPQALSSQSLARVEASTVGGITDPFLDEADIPLRPATSAAYSAPAINPFMDDDDYDTVSIPRIGIHFFMESDDSAQVCETVSADRRMTRAQCMVRTGGISEAIHAYGDQPTPSLIIVESHSRGRDLMNELTDLAQVCDAGTKVVVIGAHNDIQLYRELMRQGVSEYMVAPVQPLQLIKSIASLFTDPDTPFVGRAIAFVGARGGAGSSSLAHNFAYNLSESLQSNTVIVDYDLPFGTAGLDFNQDPLQGMADALNEPDRLDPVLLDRMLTKCGERLSLFSAPASLDQDYTAGEDAYEDVTRKIRSSAPYIVMDLPHVWTPWLKKNLITADDVVIVATPDLASLRNAKNIVDLLKTFRPNDAAPKLVLNQTEMPGRPEIPVKDFTAAIGLTPAAVIPFDAKLFGQASNNGQMIAECAPTSKVHEGLTQLTAVLTGRQVEVKAPKSFLAKLFKK